MYFLQYSSNESQFYLMNTSHVYLLVISQKVSDIAFNGLVEEDAFDYYDINKKRISSLMKEHDLLVTKINRYKNKRKMSRPKPKAI